MRIYVEAHAYAAVRIPVYAYRRAGRDADTNTSMLICRPMYMP